MSDPADNVVRDRPAEEPAAYGDADDHLRLTFLLGRLAVARGSKLEEARACQSEPKWASRLEALTRLLQGDVLSGLVFHDLDALQVGAGSTTSANWDDARLVEARAQTFEVVAEAAVRLQWRLVRPAPHPSTTAALTAVRGMATADEADGSAAVLAPELRRIRDALILNGRLTLGAWEDEVDAAEGGDDTPDLALLVRADDALSPEARDAALHLSLPRGEQAWNGRVGPFTLADELVDTVDALEVHSLSRQGARELLELGLLHGRSGRVRMPRLVRKFYAARAAHTGDVDHGRVQAWLARTIQSDDHDPASIERHHHAILSGDATLALDESFPYRQDLRILGTNLGRQGGLSNWRAAFKVFEFILKQDPEDAYAWEYSGYNLARANPHNRSPVLFDRVLTAYQNAVRHDDDNPLYRGRLLGWRGEWGHDIVDEFRHRILAVGSNSIAASWLAFPALSGLRRGQQWSQLNRLRVQMGEGAVDRWLRRERAA